MGPAKIVLLVLTLLLATSVLAEVPQLINYQGYLTDSEGKVVPDGNYSVTFKIYDDPETTSHLWAEGQLVTVQDGLFAVILGPVVPFPADLFDGPDRWLSIQVGLDPQMTPRSRLTSVPYAAHSASADNADVATTSLDKTVDAGELTEGTLDLERFSAYSDLVEDDAVGVGNDQVAPGVHSHTVGGMSTIEESTTVHTVVRYGDGWVNIKSIIIPASTIGNYFRTSWTATNTRTSGSGTLEYRIRINNFVAWTDYEVNGLFSGMLVAQRIESSDWSYWFSSFARDYRPISLDVSVPIVVTLEAQAWYSTDAHNVTAGTVVVEYLPAD